MAEEELRGLSCYAFWRIFDVHKNTVSKKKKERFIGLTGLGWPAHAKTTHPKHEEYARNTRIAYSPCPGNAGTDYIVTMVQEHFACDWRRALRAFVLDPTCEWCHTWVQRNHEVLNDVLCGFPHEHMPFPDLQADALNAGDASFDTKNVRFHTPPTSRRSLSSKAVSQTIKQRAKPTKHRLTNEQYATGGPTKTDQRGRHTASSGPISTQKFYRSAEKSCKKSSTQKTTHTLRTLCPYGLQLCRRTGTNLGNRRGATPTKH